MNRNCHIESRRSSPPQRASPGVNRHRRAQHDNRGFNDAIPEARWPWQSILSSRSARVGVVTLYLAAVFLLCLPGFGLAFNFPSLTSRVVDQPRIMSTQSRSELEAKLKTLEDKSAIQVVDATVKSLEGSDIETYANQLFRNWRLGEAKKHNGVLLLVAPNEHKVRIEVGYGLEGMLTDALSSV